MKQKKWYSYLWIVELLYLCLGLFNILFAWLGMLFFTIPLLIAVFGGGKAYCNRYCGRGQLLGLLGEKLKLSRNAPPPKFLRSRWFRYGFLAFFMTMFGLMLFSTYKVFTGAPLQQTVTLLWVFKLPWQWAEVDMVSPWIAQFAFGFFSVMLNLYRPRFCDHGPVPAKVLVCVLPHGDDDAGDLYPQTRKRGGYTWKKKQRRSRSC